MPSRFRIAWRAETSSPVHPRASVWVMGRDAAATGAAAAAAVVAFVRYAWMLQPERPLSHFTFHHLVVPVSVGPSSTVPCELVVSVPTKLEVADGRARTLSFAVVCPRSPGTKSGGAMPVTVTSFAAGVNPVMLLEQEVVS